MLHFGHTRWMQLPVGDVAVASGHGGLAPREGSDAVSLSRAWLLAELVVLFGILPAVYAQWGIGHVPLVLPLWAVALWCWQVLRRDPSFERRELTPSTMVQAAWGPMLARFAASALFMTGLVAAYAPETLFDWPRQQTAFWLLVLALYPIASVIPQELVWRTFFLHRYRTLLPDRRARIAASAVAFGYCHIVFLHWLPVLLTLVAGAIFAYTYERSRSLWAVIIEHALYGCLMFTIGLGAYFSSAIVAAQRGMP